ncbi:MAG: hypothetical protein JO064_11405 [Actinobacteria bacterium]|nr:hypothetical protein [Actinomycetota bacterium]
MKNDAPPTVKQVYAIAAALCKDAGEEFPRDRAAASELIRKLRAEPPTTPAE